VPATEVDSADSRALFVDPTLFFLFLIMVDAGGRVIQHHFIPIINRPISPASTCLDKEVRLILRYITYEREAGHLNPDAPLLSHIGYQRPGPMGILRPFPHFLDEIQIGVEHDIIPPAAVSTANTLELCTRRKLERADELPLSGQEFLHGFSHPGVPREAFHIELFSISEPAYLFFFSHFSYSSEQIMFTSTGKPCVGSVLIEHIA